MMLCPLPGHAGSPGGPAPARRAAGRVLRSARTPGTRLDEVCVVGRLCDQPGKLLCGFP